MALAAIAQDPAAFVFASASLRASPHFVIAVVQESVEPKRGISKPTVDMFQKFHLISINMLQTTVPNKSTHFAYEGI